MPRSEDDFAGKALTGRSSVLPTRAYAAYAAHEPLRPFAFAGREPGAADVQLGILFCGVCHSDLHIAGNELSRTTYPCVPGHEIVGRVEKVGREPNKLREGGLTAAAAPLLCAGITTYSSLRKWKVGRGQKVGVVGLGGMRHMALKVASLG